ncbi:shikimate dehydrogenase [Ramlibacter sp. 2FC]|uniref:shikimate dehydrogenase family protein n=1 Tax=Ramlibacter sp. 2FC TaxID=2502188 RepID=UPI0010F94591|nr:shikimate dehydrogenase [Ramlibacter sp. 2FC]
MASTPHFAAPITGSTDVYLILGDPVAQVRAPESFNEIFARFGLDAVLVPVHIAPVDLAPFVKSAFRAPNIKGMWVTIPHKAPIMGVLDQCSEFGRVAGAVNAVRRNADGRLEGGLFDGEGFKASLAYFQIPFSGRRVLILGAGGASAAIGTSLALAPEGRAAEIAFYDPVPGKAAEVAARIAAATPCRVWAVDSNDPAGYDLVINGSPLGLKPGDPMPCDVARMAPQAALVDILMKNQPTPVVRAARARGLVAQPGFEMLIQQTHLYLEFMGFAEAARALREDADFIRERIYPPELAHEIRRPAGPRP